MIDNQGISTLREKIIGLGETSMRKSYYPDLQMRLEELNRFKALLNAVSDILIIVRLNDLNIMEANEATCDLFEIRQKDITDKPLETFCDIPFFIFIRDLLISNTEKDTGFTKKGVDTTFVVRSKTDEFIYLDISIKSSLFSGIEYVIIIAKPANARVKMLKELQDSEKRFRELVEFLPLVFFEIDLNGRFIYVNPYGLSMFEYTEEEICNISVFDILSPQDRERVMQNIQRRLRGEEFIAQEYQVIKKDNTTISVNIESRPFFKDNKVVGLRGFVIDITDKKLLEKQQLKTAKIDTLCLLASGIAHDFNNILTSISGNISLAMMSLDENSSAYQKLQKAEFSITKASDLITELMMFSKDLKTQKKVLNIVDVIKDTIAVYMLDPKITCITEFEDESFFVFADAVQINQVFQNMIINAIQSMNTKGGTIKIHTKKLHLHENNRLFLKPDSYVEISISDDGCGIPKENLDRIFEPYFTTKETGSGLGLATVYTIIKNHGGTVTVDSEFGFGTTFKIYLPSRDNEETDGLN